jgi:hypothetical protein
MPPKNSKKAKDPDAPAKPSRNPHNFGRPLPDLIPKPPPLPRETSDHNQNNGSIRTDSLRQPTVQPQQMPAQVTAPGFLVSGDLVPPSDPSFGYRYPPYDFPQTFFNPATLGRIYGTLPGQGPTFGQGQGYDQGPAYRQTYAQAYNSMYQVNNGTQQGFNMLSSSFAPVAGPSYDNSGAQPAPPGYNSQALRYTPRQPGSSYEYTGVYTQPNWPLRMHSGATPYGQIPAAPAYPVQGYQQYQAPAPDPAPAIPQYPGRVYNRVDQQQRSLSDAMGGWGYNDLSFAPTPPRLSLSDPSFGQYPAGQAPEPSAPFVSSLRERPRKRPRRTAECVPGNRGDHEEAERMQSQGRQGRAQRRQYASQAQFTADAARALVQHAAITVEAEQEQRVEEEAHEEPPAAYRRVSDVTEEEQEEGDKAEKQGQYLDQGEQSSGHNHDSGYHEQEAQGQAGDSQEKAEPEPTGQDDQDPPYDDEVIHEVIDWDKWLEKWSQCPFIDL